MCKKGCIKVVIDYKGMSYRQSFDMYRAQ
jgi:hypothetical protein